jgi:hypothetical protein
MRVLLVIPAIFAIVLVAPILLVVAIALGPAAWGLAGIALVTGCVLFVMNLASAWTRHTRVPRPRG